MEWLKQYKNEIKISIISGLLVLILSNVAQYFIAVAPQAGYSILREVNDGIYYHAAHQTSNSFFIEITFCIIILAIASIFVLAIKSFKAIRKEKELSEMVKNLTQIKSKIEKGGNGDEQMKKLQSLETNRNKGNENIIKKIKISIVGLLLLAAFIFFWIFTYVLLPMAIWDKFERDIIMISPYIEEKEVLILRSEWVRMTRYDDYSKIYTFIKTKKTENNILP